MVWRRHGAGHSSRSAPLQAVEEASVAFGGSGGADGHAEGFGVADEDDEAAAAGDSGVEEIALEHDKMLGADGDDDGGKFAALAFVDGDGVGWAEFVDVAAFVDGLAAVLEFD